MVSGTLAIPLSSDVSICPKICLSQSNLMKFRASESIDIDSVGLVQEIQTCWRQIHHCPGLLLSTPGSRALPQPSGGIVNWERRRENPSLTEAAGWSGCAGVKLR